MAGTCCDASRLAEEVEPASKSGPCWPNGVAGSAAVRVMFRLPGSSNRSSPLPTGRGPVQVAAEVVDDPIADLSAMLPTEYNCLST